MSHSVIVSGPPAVGKTTLALALAEKFSLKHVSGGDVLKEMSGNTESISGQDWWDRKEGMNFLEQRMADESFDRKVDDKLIEIFNVGSVVITSYTLPWLVKGGTKIWLAGSHKSSAQRMKMRDRMGTEEARSITQKRYDSNVSLYKRLYNIDFGADLSVFDCVIETDTLDAKEVIDIATRAVEDREKSC